MSIRQKYIYGIINSSQGKTFKLLDEKAYVVPYDDISAVVSDTPKVDHTLLSREKLAGLLVHHQQVIEKVMASASIIPMRLGTFAAQEEEVKQLLIKGYPLIKKVFDRVAGAIEVDVAATWSNFGQELKAAGETAEIREFKRALLDNPNNITIDDQMKVGLMVKKVIDAKKEKIATHIQGVFKKLSREFKTHENMGDQMVFNFAFLINSSLKELFDQKIEELNAGYNDRLNFRRVGPLPPYSFYTLEARWLKPAEIARAKKTLGLVDGELTRAEVKKAYQQAALLAHPDVNGGDGHDFMDVTEAYKILWEYGLAPGQGGLTLRVKGA